MAQYFKIIITGSPTLSRIPARSTIVIKAAASLTTTIGQVRKCFPRATISVGELWFCPKFPDGTPVDHNHPLRNWRRGTACARLLNSGYGRAYDVQVASCTNWRVRRPQFSI